MERYQNYFENLGYTEEEIQKRLEKIFEILFYGEEERIFFLEGDMGYMLDTGYLDVRTEGMSYGMMICVQLDKKKEFDALWKWAKKYMYMEDGTHRGYFAWSCKPDGTPNSKGPAPDGEEYFAMALLFASHRWGDGEGIFNYGSEAKKLLHRCLHADRTRQEYTMWDPQNFLIRFVPEADFTDPSYHLPHFYELFSQWSYEEDKAFWKKAAMESRNFLLKTCHPETGLSPEYAEYNGAPFRRCQGIGANGGRRDRYYNDAYRTGANIGLDALWFGKDAFESAVNVKLVNFFADKPNESAYDVYELNGRPIHEDKIMHPTAITATNAMASIAIYMLLEENLAVDKIKLKENADNCIRRFWDTKLRKGNRRYYDNCLYMLAFLALSGNYKIY